AAFACSAGLPMSTAAEVVIPAGQDPALTSSFTLDFGVFGVSNAEIASTTMELAVDPVTEQARLGSYHQQIAPLTLPGGISTGHLTVEIVPGSSAGAFTRGAATGRFNTAEIYRIHFTGDLSAYGMTSPIDLPGASAGVARFTSSTAGTIDMDWDG